jgi:hypothetical protein
MIQLSILIPTVPERVEMFTRLFNEVNRQVVYCSTIHPTLGHVQVLVDDSKRFLDGGLSIGKKREKLIRSAVGKYVCFIDDDEDIAGNYVEQLLRATHKDADIITFSSFAKLEQYWMVVQMTLDQKINEEGKPGFIRRPPWHMCPVRSIFAKIHDFEDISYGEDWRWMQNVLSHCTGEFHIPMILHSYQHGKHSLADKITQHY